MTKPYYQSDLCTFYLGDCLEILPTLPDADLLVTDPPYGISFRSNHGQNHGGIEGDEDTGLAIEALRIVRLRSKRHAYVFWSSKQERPDPEPLRFQAWVALVWDKGNLGMGGKHCWGTSHEEILFAARIPSKANRKDGTGNGAARLRRGTVLRYPRLNSGGNRRHPTEKPVGLLRELVESSSKFRETVLDPFAGVGSTLVAAILEGRKAVGIEIEEKYARVAVERIRYAEEIAACCEGRL